MATLGDRDCIDEAWKSGLDIDVVDGEQVQSLIASIFAKVPALLGKVKMALQPSAE